MNETMHRELMAKIILIVYENKNFSSLRKSESPDWIDEENGIGLEVALATNRRIQQVARINSKDNQSEREDAIVSKLGSFVTMGNKKVIMSHTLFGNTIEAAFYDTIFDKISKLNKKYQRFESNLLFMFVSDPLTDIDVVLRLIESLSMHIKDISYDTIYCCIDSKLIKCDTKSNSICYSKKIDLNYCDELMKKFEDELLLGHEFDY